MAGQHEGLMRSMYDEVMSAGDLDRIAELCTEDIVDPELPPGMPSGVDGVKAFMQMMRGAFPDLRATMQDYVEQGDRAVARARFTGTHQGELMGVAASGNAIDLECIDMIRVVDGKCAEHWGAMDNLALMQQIGAIPEAA